VAAHVACPNQKGEKSVFTTTLTLEEIAHAQAQLTKAKYPLISD